MVRIAVVLGASDPEMEVIRRLAQRQGLAIHQATVDGRPVHPGNAYQANGTHPPLGSGDYDAIWLVECSVASLPTPIVVRILDHHKPGDFGYGKPPEDYFAASSLGQLIQGLNLVPSEEEMKEYRLVAAADHCLAAAYQGRCPGVDPEELMNWRIQSRAQFQRRDPATVLADVQNARRILQEAPRLRFEQWEIADLRDRNVPELPEAAARDQVPFLAVVVDPDKRQKVVLQAAPPELVQAFLEGKLLPGIQQPYGDPSRGFAGAYL